MTDCDQTAIRSLERTDVDAVAQMERQIFTDPWPREAFEELIADRLTLNLVASTPDGALCGYLCAQVVADELQIHNVAVSENRRRSGLGRRMLEEAETEAKRRGAQCALLEVRINNAPALAMYGRMGYRRIARRRRYYRQPVCDALVLMKVFDEHNAADDKTVGYANGMVS